MLKRELKPLTGIRFFLAFGVLIFHYGNGFLQSAGAPDQLVNLLRHGYLGVSAFFMLSGFVLSYSHDDRTISRNAFPEYLTARLARIYPVYIISLLLALPFVIKSLTSQSIGAVLLLIQSWGPIQSHLGGSWIMQAWSLSCEFFFYLAFPLLLPLSQKSTKTGCAYSLLWLGAAILILNTPTMAPGFEPLPRYLSVLPQFPLPIVRLTEFIFGMQIYRLAKLLNWKPMPSYSATAILFAILVTGTFTDAENGFCVSLMALLLGALIYNLATTESWLARSLSKRHLMVLGGASYGMYITQQPIHDWTVALAPSAMLGRALTPLVIVTASCVLFLYVETPMRNLIRKFSKGTRMVNTAA